MLAWEGYRNSSGRMKHILMLLLSPQHLQLLSQLQRAFTSQEAEQHQGSCQSRHSNLPPSRAPSNEQKLLPMPNSTCQAVEMLTRPIWGSLPSIGTPTALPWLTFLPLTLATGSAKSSSALLAAALPLAILLTFTLLLTTLSTACSSDVTASASSTCEHNALRVIATTSNVSVYWLACTAT